MSDSDSVNWKEKFRQLARQMEADAAARAETEQLLCRTITRLAAATGGLDPLLDPHLKALGDAARNGVDDSLKRNLDAFSDALLRAQDDRSARQAETKPPEELLRRLLGRPALSGLAARRIKRLGDRLMADPEAVSDEQLDELLTLLSAGQEASPAAEPDAGAVSVPALTDQPVPAPGFFSRLFRPAIGAAAKAASDDANRRLLELLERLDWPAQLRGDIDTFKGALGPEAGTEAWLGVIESLAQSVGRALGDVQSEMRKTETFLGDLTGRLQEIADRVLTGRDARDAAIKDSADLSQVVSAEVGGIRHAVRKATDLQQLKVDVAMRLDAIQVRVTAHMQAEERRYHEHDETEKLLRGRLQALEEEAAALRQEMTEAYYKALQDPVTGLPNRAAYDERMHQEYSRWKRFGSLLVLLVWDIDNFKSINDRFGHSAGDKALSVIGRILAERVRETDFVARYGGEEFALLMTGAVPENALRVAEQIREAIVHSGFHSGDKPVALTISCGISDFREGDTPEAVFERADKAMYQAKIEGKNRCIIAS